MVQVERMMLLAIEYLHIERTADCHNDFFTSAMGMTSTALPRGYIISPIDASNVKRYVFQLLRHRQIASWVYNLRKLYQLSGTSHKGQYLRRSLPGA